MSGAVRIAVPAVAAAAFFTFGWWMAWALIAGRTENTWGYVLLSLCATVGFACAAVSAAWEQRP